MQFLFRSLIKEFKLHRTQRSVSLSFSRDGIHLHTLLRRQRKNDFSGDLAAGESTVIEVRADLDVNAETDHCLEMVSQGLIPHFKQLTNSSDYFVKENLKNMVEPDGKIKAGREDILDLLPDAIDQDIDSARDQLRLQARILVDTIRWRQDLSGPHEPIGRSELFWRTSEDEWVKVPGSYGAWSSVHNVLGHSKKWKTPVQRILNEGGSAPVAFGLLREAVEVHASNPRSALVIGVAAAEIGVKQCIANLVPDAEWLAFNYQGITIDKILSKYIPIIAANQNEDVLNELKRLRKAFIKANDDRNALVHRAGVDITSEKVRSYLGSIKRLIRLLDAISIYPWALRYVYVPTMN